MQSFLSRFLLALPLLMTTCLARAQDEGAAAVPAETVSIVYVILFIVLFFGMIAGFFVYLWWQERKRDASKDASK